jgi:UDP-N-acetylglucosamine--N-acetylmuramyl-(pentapeptide) pyrophosphoryl-undecaprenol N-acetylglucosamine transferase
VPLVLLNVDAVPGATNRLLGRFAKASAVGWEGNPLPRAVVTGTPVRPAISSTERMPPARDAARTELGMPLDRQLVVVFGGSLGARQINRAVDGLIERWHGRNDLAIYHIVGRRDWGAYAAEASVERIAHPGPGPNGLELVRVPYEERMPLVYEAADLMVCRAGAMTVAELAAGGVPAVLIPLPGAPGDHQTANARVLEKVGAAVVLPDPECTPTGLAGVVDELLIDPGRLLAMGRAARGVARPDAAEAGARVVEANALPEVLS